MPNIQTIPDSTFIPLEEKAAKLERYGYVFHITPRAWTVRTRSGIVLKEVVHFDDTDRNAGGLSPLGFRQLGLSNFEAAVNWAVQHWNEGVRKHRMNSN